MSNQYVRFRVRDETSLASVERVVQLFREEAKSEKKRTDEEWKALFKALFNEQSLKYFWWPSAEELEEWKALWLGTHYTKRHLLPRTRWHFGSFIETVRTNEWELLGVKRLPDGQAEIEFMSYSYPFGGTDCLVALAEAFGNEVIERDDGTGPLPYEKVKQYWQPKSKGRSCNAQ